MKFIVIEGDNGTGKDSLAQIFEKKGMLIVTYLPEVIEKEKEAKKLNGKEKIKKFLEYNKLCGEIARSKSSDTMLIRFWLSTLAAGYSDSIYNLEETMQLFDKCLKELGVPDIVIRLKCNFDERIKRINERNSDEFDDKTLNRSKKYQFITEIFIKKLNMIKWINIETTNKSKEQIFEEAYNKIYEKKVYRQNS